MMAWLIVFVVFLLIVVWLVVSFGMAESQVDERLTLVPLVVGGLLFCVGIFWLMTHASLIARDDLLTMWSMMLSSVLFLGVAFTALRIGIRKSKVSISLVFVVFSFGVSCAAFYKGMSVCVRTMPSHTQIVALVKQGHHSEASKIWCYLNMGEKHKRFPSCWNPLDGDTVEKLRNSSEMQEAFVALAELTIQRDILELGKSYETREYRYQRKKVQQLLEVIRQLNPEWPLLKAHLSKEYENCQNHPRYQSECFEMLLRRWVKNGDTSHPWVKKTCERLLPFTHYKSELEWTTHDKHLNLCLSNSVLLGLKAGWHVIARAKTPLHNTLFELPVQDWYQLLASYKWLMVNFDEKHQIIFNEHYQPILIIRTDTRNFVAAQTLLPPKDHKVGWTFEQIQAVFERLTDVPIATLTRATKTQPALLKIKRDAQGDIESATFGEMPLVVSVQAKTLVAYHSAIRPIHRQLLSTHTSFASQTEARLERSYGLSAVRLMRDLETVPASISFAHIHAIAPKRWANKQRRFISRESIESLENKVYRPKGSLYPIVSSFPGSSQDSSSSSISGGTSPSTTISFPSTRSGSFGSRSSSSGGYSSGKN